MRHIYIILLFGLLGCTTETKKVKTKGFDRYVFALTFSNNAKNKIDSTEITNEICHTLIYLTKNNYCEMLSQNGNKNHFYKGIADSHYADSLIEVIEALNTKYKTKFYSSLSCLPDMNIIVENDSSTTYKFISTYDENIYKLINNFEVKSKLHETDTLENVLKYKYYITNTSSYFIKSLYGFSAVNNYILQFENDKGVLRREEYKTIDEK